MVPSSLVKGVHLPYPKVAHGPPLHISEDEIGYIMLRPWKQFIHVKIIHNI